MELSNIRFNSLEAFAGADTVIAIKSEPLYEWLQETGTRSDQRIGSKITIVCPKREFAKQTVAIKHQEEELYDKLFTSSEGITVGFENFTASIYKNRYSDEYAISAKADKMIPVRKQAG